jgi:predicted glycosyltransferase
LQIRRLGEILQVNLSELDNLNGSVQQKQDEMVAHDTAPKRRTVLLSEMRDLQETVVMVETEIDGIEAALEEENRRLQNLRGGTRYR